jgi:hypothetical protein
MDDLMTDHARVPYSSEAGLRCLYTYVPNGKQ